MSINNVANTGNLVIQLKRLLHKYGGKPLQGGQVGLLI